MRLNILLLTGANPYSNHSGIVALDIYKSLSEYGHKVTMFTRYYDERFEKGVYSVYNKRESYIRETLDKFKTKLPSLQKINPRFYMHSVNEGDSYINVKKILEKVSSIDVIIHLFPQRFLNFKNLYELNLLTGAPVFIMPMDMAPFTGGCHYANDCRKYESGCGECPGLLSTDSTDKTYENSLNKKKFISKTKAAVLANTWLTKQAKKSLILSSKPVFNLDLAINERTFIPGDQNRARNVFSIPKDKRIIFFGAATVTEERKGLSYLIEALSALYSELKENERNSIGVAIAGTLPDGIKNIFPFETYNLGHLNHEKLARAFQMADVFVSPSIQDAGPMMVIQAMLCGTPVVAFEMGNAIDFIVDDITGYKVPLYDKKALKTGIYKILIKGVEEKKKISENCRNYALNKSSYKTFASKFLSIYKEFKTKY